MVAALVKSPLSELGVTKDHSSKESHFKESSSESIESSDEEGVSQQEDLPLLDQLLPSAKERLDYETFASPVRMGLPDKDIRSQTKVQTLLRAQ